MPPMKNKSVPLLLIILFALAAWTPQYFSRGLWEPDEPRYTYVAREMAQNGSFFMPRRNGEFYAHKPPLMFWLIQAGTLFTGGEFNGISGRAPTLLGIILALWAFTGISTLWYDRKTAWWALFILSTSFLFWHKGGTGQIDMLLLGLELCALLFLFKNDGTPRLRNSVAAFCFMGLAILAKGPVGLIVPCGIYLTSRVMSGEKKLILKKHWLWGIPLAMAWPAAWLVLAKINGAPDAYFNELLFDQNLGRAQGTFGGHYHPFYYYLKYLIIDFMPWSFFMPVTVMILAKQTAIKKQSMRLAGWILFVVFFFSLCGGKRNLYILAVYPAASLLLASALPAMAAVSDRWKKISIYPVITVFGLLGLGLLIAAWLPTPLPRAITMGGAGLLLTGALLLGRLHRYIPMEKEWFGIFISFLLILFFYVGTFVFPPLNAVKAPREVSRQMATQVPENQPLLYYRMNGEIISLYAHRQGKRFDTPQALLAGMKKNRQGVVVFSMGHYKTISPFIVPYGEIKPFKLGSKHLAWQAYALPSSHDGLSSLNDTSN